MKYQIKRLGSADLDTIKKLLQMYADAFGYRADDLPDNAYLQELLDEPDIYMLAAMGGDKVVGGVTAYALALTSKEEKELYLYDIAVAEGYRRQGIGSAVVDELRALATKDGVARIFVDAESVDVEAVSFYESIGADSTDVQHFTISMDEAI